MQTFDKKSIKLIIVLVVLMLISLILILILTGGKGLEQKISNESNKVQTPINDKENNEQQEVVTDHKLRDHNRYFTLNELVNNFIVYTNSRNNEAMSMLMLEDYKVNKQITNQNILSIILNDDYIYNASKIFEYQINERIIKYNISGYKTIPVMDGISEKKEYNVTLYLDTENMTYALALEDDYNANVLEIAANKYNSYEIKNMSDQQIAYLYYSDIFNKILRNENLEDIITNYERFKEKEISIGNISSYKVTEKNDKYNILVVDDNKVSYNFNIDAVLDYKVTIS